LRLFVEREGGFDLTVGFPDRADRELCRSRFARRCREHTFGQNTRNSCGSSSGRSHPSDRLLEPRRKPPFRHPPQVLTDHGFRARRSASTLVGENGRHLLADHSEQRPGRRAVHTRRNRLAGEGRSSTSSKGPETSPTVHADVTDRVRRRVAGLESLRGRSTTRLDRQRVGCRLTPRSRRITQRRRRWWRVDSCHIPLSRFAVGPGRPTTTAGLTTAGRVRTGLGAPSPSPSVGGRQCSLTASASSRALRVRIRAARPRARSRCPSRSARLLQSAGSSPPPGGPMPSSAGAKL